MQMKLFCISGLIGGFLAGPALAGSQEQTDFYRGVEKFEKSWPTVGDRLPELTLFTPQGNEVKTSALRGHYTVLTLGCLT